MASFLKCKSKSITMVWPHFQRQSGSDDSGLFAIASAFELCLGEDPTRKKYNQVQMRAHLMSCFFKDSLSSFDSSRRRPHRPVRTENVEVFCSCRRPFSARSGTTTSARGVNMNKFQGNQVYKCNHC